MNRKRGCGAIDRVNNRKNVSVLILVFSLMLFSFPSFISAHAYIVKSSPSENEVLKQSPQKVSIQFDETIQSVYQSIGVYDTNGKRVDQKNGRINPKNSTILECGLNRNLPNGTYRIQWKALSSDGHPVQGVIPFQIGSGINAQGESAAIQEGYTPHLDLILIRWVQYFSNACYIGALFFYLLIIPKELLQNQFVKNTFSKMVKYSFLFLALSILISLPLMATVEFTTSWSNVFTIQTLKDMMTNTIFGKIWIIQVGGLVVLSILTYLLSVKKVHKPVFVWISFILGIGLLLTKSLTSHAASAISNRILTIGMDFFHLASASIWIGSLVAFVTLIPLSTKMNTKIQYMEMIRRFSKWGILIILVLSITGVFGSFLYIPNPRSLINTDYGKTLSSKIILLVIMVIFAAMNFFKGKKSNAKGLSATLWGELATGLIVLILSVVLTNLPTAMSSPGPVNETKLVEYGNKVTLHITPNKIGENTLEVSLKDQKGQAMKEIEQVTLTFTSLEMDMGKDTITLSKVKKGIYRAKSMNLNMSGRWSVHVHVLTKDLEAIDTDIKCIVGSQ